MSDEPLPDCDAVFQRYFARWYSADDMRRRGYRATRPDAERVASPGSGPEAVCELGSADAQAVARSIATMRESLAGDWPGFLDVREPLSLLWIDAFDNYWTRERVHDLLARTDPASYSNDLLVVCCEFGAALGEVMREQSPQLAWLHDWPYWESALLDVPSGYRINVFHWAVKRFSESGIEDGYVAKVRACLDLVRAGWPEPEEA